MLYVKPDSLSVTAWIKLPEQIITTPFHRSPVVLFIQQVQTQANMGRFADELLLKMFAPLKKNTLYHLLRTCKQFFPVAQELLCDTIRIQPDLRDDLRKSVVLSLFRTLMHKPNLETKISRLEINAENRHIQVDVGEIVPSIPRDVAELLIPAARLVLKMDIVALILARVSGL
jgi:hypothetical protein